MGVILWNHIFKTILGYFLLVSKNEFKIGHNFIFTYSWKTFGFELLHSLEHILLDATSWGLGIHVGIMPWNRARSVPPLVHLDPLLHPGLNNPAIIRPKKSVPALGSSLSWPQNICETPLLQRDSLQLQEDFLISTL